MSEEKKCVNREELPEGVTELSMEDLEQVTGGVRVELGRSAIADIVADYETVTREAAQRAR